MGKETHSFLIKRSILISATTEAAEPDESSEDEQTTDTAAYSATDNRSNIFKNGSGMRKSVVRGKRDHSLVLDLVDVCPFEEAVATAAEDVRVEPEESVTTVTLCQVSIAPPDLTGTHT